MLDYFYILAGFFVAQALVINIKYGNRSRGYIWRAMLWIWSFLLLVTVVELIIAGALFAVSANSFSSYASIPRVQWALLLGVLVVILPNTVEYFILYRNASEEKITKDFVKTFRKLNLDIIHKFGDAIQTRRRHDVFDCQVGGGFNLGLSREEVGRRVRLLYSYHKREIALQNKNLKHLDDSGSLLWEMKLYLLLEYLGRRRLINAIRNPIPFPDPLREWNGRERRRQKGTKANRNDQSPDNPTYEYPRCGDDEDLRSMILRGRS